MATDNAQAGTPESSPVVLLPLSRQARHTFAAAMAADYLEYLVSKGKAADPTAAVEAQAEIAAEIEAGARSGDGFWAANKTSGETVGWLWVKYAAENLPPDTAFLYQILVLKPMRRQGYGQAMLAALELVLASQGWIELRLNLWKGNTAARGLYRRAGYELVEQFPSKLQLRKRLT